LAKNFFSIPSSAEYYAPDFMLNELHQHKKKLLQVSGLSETAYEYSKASVFGQVRFVDTDTIPEKYLQQAAELTRQVDFKDFKFVAPTIVIDGLLWTGDRKLLNGL
jgi:predicted nucleic acid-binding protein